MRIADLLLICNPQSMRMADLFLIRNPQSMRMADLFLIRNPQSMRMADLFLIRNPSIDADGGSILDSQSSINLESPPITHQSINPQSLKSHIINKSAIRNPQSAIQDGSERGPVALPVFKIGCSPFIRGGSVRLRGASANLRSRMHEGGLVELDQRFVTENRRDDGFGVAEILEDDIGARLAQLLH